MDGVSLGGSSILAIWISTFLLGFYHRMHSPSSSDELQICVHIAATTKILWIPKSESI